MPSIQEYSFLSYFPFHIFVYVIYSSLLFFGFKKQ